MFDDHIQKPNNQGQPPGNLPIGEPEDMFSSTEDDPGAHNAGGDIPANIMAQPEHSLVEQESRPLSIPEQQKPASAVQAGVLRPAMNELPPQPHPEFSTMPQDPYEGVDNSRPGGQIPSNMQQGERQPPEPQYPDQQSMYEPQHSGKGKIILLVFIILALLGGVSWVAYSKFIAPQDDTDGVLPPPVTQEPVQEPAADEPIDQPSPDEGEPLDNKTVDDSLLFGQPIDEDGDGLDDQREATLGTDPKNWDSDGDELSDGDEVIIWKTNPLNPDSDGDGYADGAEVRAGYSPSGPGRLFEPPATSTNP